jgi:hypothetical protein
MRNVPFVMIGGRDHTECLTLLDSAGVGEEVDRTGICRMSLIRDLGETSCIRRT